MLSLVSEDSVHSREPSRKQLCIHHRRPPEQYLSCLFSAYPRKFRRVTHHFDKCAEIFRQVLVGKHDGRPSAMVSSTSKSSSDYSARFEVRFRRPFCNETNPKA